MADPFTLMIASTAMSGVQAFAQMSHANSMAEAAYAANEEQLRFLQEDVSRRKDEVRREYQEARSDRVMRANQEIAMAELLAMQRGASGSTMQSMVRHLATVEGIDLSRIRATQDNQQAALDSELRAGTINSIQSNQRAANEARVARTNALFGAVGSGLQIYTGYRRDQASTDAMRNRTS